MLAVSGCASADSSTGVELFVVTVGAEEVKTALYLELVEVVVKVEDTRQSEVVDEEETTTAEARWSCI